MPVLTRAGQMMRGTEPRNSMYEGAKQVWPTQESEPGTGPDSIPGLAIWLDAADYTLGSWPNKAIGGAVPVFKGTPNPTISTNTLNGLRLVRFKPAQGRVRILSGSGVTTEWTLIYVARMVGPTYGRVVNGIYPPNNLLVGWWNGNQDAMYDAGFANNSYVAWTSDWKTYSADGTTNYQGSGSQGSRLFSDGVLLGTLGTGQGWGGTFSISGYDAEADSETCDCEVAEVIQYNRKLSDIERSQVEDYLHNKWFMVTDPLAGFDFDTQAYLVTTGLDLSYAPALDTLVRDLKANGLWSKMSAIYPFIGGTADLHKWNLKDPRDSDAAYRLTFYDPAFHSGHSTALGYRANSQGAQISSGSYADTHFVPRGNLDQNSTHLSFYSTQDVPPGDRAEMGNFNWTGTSGSRFHIIARYLGVNAYYYGMSEEGTSNIGMPAASGLFVATRIASNVQTGYRNGVKVSAGINNNPSIPLPPTSVYIGAINQFANRSDIPCGFASIGSALDDRNVSDLYNIVQAYQTALNRQV